MILRAFILVISMTLAASLARGNSFEHCHPKGMTVPNHEAGLLDVPLEYGEPGGEKIQLYWEKFPSKSPKKGTVFFLAGGPISHLLYHGENSPYFIEDLFPDYDFVMFDYRGFNCSSLIKTPQELNGISQHFTMSTFAKDFRQLKNYLVGKDEKVVIYGGSLGYMLGTQILKDFPEEISHAILGWGDTNSDWYFGSIEKLDHLLTKTLPDKHPDFLKKLTSVFEKFDRGEVVLFEDTENEFHLTKNIFSVYLWFGFAPSMEAQESLPALLEEILKGNFTSLEKLHLAYLNLLNPAKIDSPPTIESAVLNIFRCNIHITKKDREYFLKTPKMYDILDTVGLAEFLISLCREYRDFPEFKFDITDQIEPIDVPVLAWMGARDWFDEIKAKENLEKFGPKVEVHIMNDWSHDFGLDAISGMQWVRDKVREFLTQE